MKNNTISAICSKKIYNGKQISLSLFIIALAWLISFAIYLVNDGFSSSHSNVSDFSSLLIYTFVFIAAFVYEILALVILDKMGYEEKISNHSGMVMRTYGLMGVGAVISMWLLGISDNFLQSSFFMLAVSLLCALLLLWKRNFLTIAALSSLNEDSLIDEKV